MAAQRLFPEPLHLAARLLEAAGHAQGGAEHADAVVAVDVGQAQHDHVELAIDKVLEVLRGLLAPFARALLGIVGKGAELVILLARRRCRFVDQPGGTFDVGVDASARHFAAEAGGQ